MFRVVRAVVDAPDCADAVVKRCDGVGAVGCVGHAGFVGFVGLRPIRDIHHDQMLAGCVQHMTAVRADAGVEHRQQVVRIGVVYDVEGVILVSAGVMGVRVIDVRGVVSVRCRRQSIYCKLSCARTAAVIVDLREEQLTVDGEDHAVACRIDRIRHDALPAFACAFATGPFRGGNLFGFGVGEQFARVGEQDFLVRAGGGVECAQPQRCDAVLRAVGAQEQRPGTVPDNGCRTRCPAGEPQGAGFMFRELFDGGLDGCRGGRCRRWCRDRRCSDC